ncbi:CLAVATA3 [Arabidopsis thaliana]|uniref:CLAVATA3 n=1 Tax=Arabidopsis thaliana TaxID=3702 RepID=Q3E6N8_ARATH|nr:CLAVATA3 [Arabidopsis thaliana]AEC07962.1 CLAVATA3 [Arabidopsis thaliana]|eukprot:NP_565641.2 CLAVATA3 [Arabidopsis thaliana]
MSGPVQQLFHCFSCHEKYLYILLWCAKHSKMLFNWQMMMMKMESEWVGANGEAEKAKTKGLGLHEELRTVPSGPDPLHHHVNPPRQPRNNFQLP